ncbi:MAG: glutamate 5-kinase [Candidatus Omnitrophota bacterium]
MKQSQKNYNRIVIKVGSSLLCSQELACESFESSLVGIAAQIAQLVESGRQVVVVTSGAIAFGMRLLKMKSRPGDLSLLQAAAAVGQHLLMNEYRSCFEEKGLTSAQVLLTWDDFSDRKRYLNAKNTLLALLRFKSIPVINENDTVSTDEIKFGDNDRLSSLVATLVSADLLLILSDIDGLLDKEKHVIRVVSEINSEVKSLACPTDKKTCVGGMVTKLEAAKIAVDSGIPCVIANGRHKNIILSVVNDPASAGTLFIPKQGSLAARERWLAFGAKPKARIIIDGGAKQALLKGKSLLSVGVLGVEGNFESKDVVSIKDLQRHEIARGKANVSSKHLEKVLGVRSDKEVVHCDNIVIL